VVDDRIVGKMSKRVCRSQHGPEMQGLAGLKQKILNLVVLTSVSFPREALDSRSVSSSFRTPEVTSLNHVSTTHRHPEEATQGKQQGGSI